MILGKRLIEAFHKQGVIIFHPYEPDLISGTQVDLPLGGHIATPKDGKDHIFDPAVHSGEDFYTIQEIPDDGYLLEPGKRVLSYTHHFIGSKATPFGIAFDGEGPDQAAPLMTLRPMFGTVSTSMRIGLDGMGSAGVGDEGYFNRLTLEIVNTATFSILLRKGMIIAQAWWELVLGGGTDYAEHGRYQTSGKSLEDVIANWKPSDIIGKRIKIRSKLPPL